MALSTTLFDKEGKELGSVDLPEVLFNAEINEALIHQAVAMKVRPSLIIAPHSGAGGRTPNPR